MRAVSLGDHATLHGNATNNCLLRKSLKFHRIKKERFVEDIIQRVPDGDDTDVDTFEKCISDVLYSCVEDSLDSGDRAAMTGSCNLGRWERLLSESDDAAVWRATDWKGDFHIDRTDDNLSSVLSTLSLC